MNDKEKKLSLLVKEEKTVQLKRRICELENECQKLSRELMAFKQEKQTEKKRFPPRPYSKKRKNKRKIQLPRLKDGF
jgi:CRISPR/Cas system endoribonuclease Cas6 (RAMP superfamily)